MSLSLTNTHANAGFCPRQEHEHPSCRGDRDTNLHAITHLFVSIPSPHTFLSLLIFTICHTRFPRCSRKVMHTYHPFSFLFGVECHFTLMYVQYMYYGCYILCLA
jgi:hypothetical protein